jgi:hypothetical protein
MPESLKKISAAVLEDFEKALASQPAEELGLKPQTLGRHEISRIAAWL